MSRSARLLFYSHNGVGVGHVQRQLRLASAYARRHPDASTLLVTGSHAVGTLRFPPRVDFVKLPSIRMVDRYRTWVPREVGMTLDEVMTMREDLIRQAVRRFKPNVLVADFLPMGPYGELVPALEELERRGGCALAGFRDIVDDPAFVRTLWAENGTQRVVEQHYAASIVYGLPEVVDFERDYHLGGAIHYVGYLGRRARPKHPDGYSSPFVLATTGGGVDGAPMLRAFIRAAADLAPRLGGTWLAVAGPLLADDEVVELDAEARRAGVQFARSLRRLGDLAAAADAVVAMGGYNTACELMSCTTPAVVVPRSGPSAEQRLRAKLLEQRGRAAVLEPDTLTPQVMAHAIEEALHSPRVPSAKLDTRGIARTVDLLAAAAAGRLPDVRLPA